MELRLDEVKVAPKVTPIQISEKFRWKKHFENWKIQTRKMANNDRLEILIAAVVTIVFIEMIEISWFASWSTSFSRHNNNLIKIWPFHLRQLLEAKYLKTIYILIVMQYTYNYNIYNNNSIIIYNYSELHRRRTEFKIDDTIYPCHSAVCWFSKK